LGIARCKMQVCCIHPNALLGKGRPPWYTVIVYRVSSKQTKINFGSNRNKPKQDLFRVCFGLFRETKNKKDGQQLKRAGSVS
jgi:hypothetical protein